MTVASERSLYSKLDLVLGTALSSEPETLSQLSDSVLAQGHSAFVTRRYDADEDDYVWKPSRPSVVRVVGMARRLGLVDDSGQLTDAGNSAHSTESSFRREIADAVAGRLGESGTSLASLNRLATELLRRSPPEMPTAAAFFEELEPSIGRAEFGRLLTLLADAEAALIAQRRIYLEFDLK